MWRCPQHNIISILKRLPVKQQQQQQQQLCGCKWISTAYVFLFPNTDNENV